VIDCLNFRGPAEASGWLERATRLVEGLPLGELHGMLAYERANIALLVEHDPAKAREIAGSMLERVPPGARAEGGVMALLSLEGLALVAGGQVAEGMRRLDEAATAARSPMPRSWRSSAATSSTRASACATSIARASGAAAWRRSRPGSATPSCS